MKLWFSEGSPFARKVRIVLAEKGLEYEKDMLNALRPVDTHKRIHPGLSIPVLQDGELVLFESNLILDYLLKTYPHSASNSPPPPLAPTMTRPAHHWEDAKTIAVLETLANAIVTLKLMRDSGATPDNVAYLKRHSARMESCLDWLEERATPEGFAPGYFSVMDINFICPVAYGEKRNVMRLEGRARLQTIMARFASRPSVASTPISDLPATPTSSSGTARRRTQ